MVAIQEKIKMIEVLACFISSLDVVKNKFPSIVIVFSVTHLLLGSIQLF